MLSVPASASTYYIFPQTSRTHSVLSHAQSYQHLPSAGSARKSSGGVCCCCQCIFNQIKRVVQWGLGLLRRLILEPIGLTDENEELNAMITVMGINLLFICFKCVISGLIEIFKGWTAIAMAAVLLLVVVPPIGYFALTWRFPSLTMAFILSNLFFFVTVFGLEVCFVVKYIQLLCGNPKAKNFFHNWSFQSEHAENVEVGSIITILMTFILAGSLLSNSHKGRQFRRKVKEIEEDKIRDANHRLLVLQMENNQLRLARSENRQNIIALRTFQSMSTTPYNFRRSTLCSSIPDAPGHLAAAQSKRSLRFHSADPFTGSALRPVKSVIRRRRTIGIYSLEVLQQQKANHTIGMPRRFYSQEEGVHPSPSLWTHRPDVLIAQTSLPFSSDTKRVVPFGRLKMSSAAEHGSAQTTPRHECTASRGFFSSASCSSGVSTCSSRRSSSFKWSSSSSVLTFYPSPAETFYLPLPT